MIKKKRGFSLIELLVVMAIFMMFVTMTVSFSIRNKDRWSLRDDAREITSLYYQAKQRAARENANVRLDIGEKVYTYYRDKSNNNSGDWEIVKQESLNKKITVSHTANFLINPMGIILTPTLPPAITGAQTITLQADRDVGSTIDQITITIYPYGGLNVRKEFEKKL